MSERQKITIKILIDDIVRQRKRLGVSQKDFADRIGMKPSSLCRFEKGGRLPDNGTLEKMALGAGLPVNTWTDVRRMIKEDMCFDDTPAFDDPEIRFAAVYPDHSVPPAEYAALVRELAKKTDEYEACDAVLQIPSFCRINLSDRRMTNEYHGMTAARDFRDALRMGNAPLRSLLPLFEQMNIRFIVTARALPPCVGAGGETKPRHTFPVHDRRSDNLVIAVNPASAPQSQLYGIAYDIGAYLRYRRFKARGTEPKTDESRFCRAFAAQLLVPYEELHELLKTLGVTEKNLRLNLLDTIAARFNVSSMMMLNVLKNYRCISLPYFKRALRNLKDPKRYGKPGTLPDRAPLPLGAWLRTLRLAAENCTRSGR